MQNAWDSLPNPKEQYEDAYMIAKYFIQLHLFFDEPENALNWANTIYQCNPDRVDSGEKEFLHGRVELELKNIKKAKELFKIAYQKSEGRDFTRDDSKYKNLIK